MIIWLSLALWLYLVLGRGGFWRSRPELAPAQPAQYPEVDIIVPARDEACTIRAVLDSLLAQDYPALKRIILIDDQSSDGTAQVAGTAPRLSILRLESKPEGWSGKLWALEHGVRASDTPLVLFTDADIVHDRRHLSTLVAQIEAKQLDLVSEMVTLSCVSVAERTLIPAFVYFFQMLYPFGWVNDVNRPTAAAAGGTMLIRRRALERIGGIASIRHALIDDVALAQAVKREGPIYLGHSRLAASIRPYAHFADVWQMIARTAFTQLRLSALLLLATLLGLALLWLVPLYIALAGAPLERGAALLALALALASYQPTLSRYGRCWLWALGLPAIAVFYMAATLGSAADHWRGRGLRWKRRAYDAG